MWVGWSKVSPPFWSTLKYLSKYWMHHHKYSWFLEVNSLTYPKFHQQVDRVSDRVLWQCNVWTTVGWIVSKYGADIHLPKRMNTNDFRDSWNFHVA